MTEGEFPWRRTTVADGRSPFWRSAALLIVASAVYCAPLFANLDKGGRQDWDQFSFRYETPRLAILRDHVLPTWNPYAEGGTVLLAHPDSPVLSPWYLIVLLFGTPVGLRVQVAVFMALGAVGMAAFLARLGATRSGGIVGGIVFMMSSHFALHMAEGHVEWCVLGVMPWLAWCLPRMRGTYQWIAPAALLLASVLTFGAVYVPAVYLPFLSLWIALVSLRDRSWRPLAGWVAVVFVALLLSSAKLLPTVAFSRQYPRTVAQTEQGSSRRFLLAGFFDPRQASLYHAFRERQEQAVIATNAGDVIPPSAAAGEALQGWSIHEYGCYVGIVGIALAALGALFAMRRMWPLYLSGVFAGVTALGFISPVDLWSALGQLPLYGQLNVPTRFLAAVVFVVAVAAAFGLDSVIEVLRKRRPGWQSTVTGVLIAVLYAELLVMGWSLFGDVFTVKAAGVVPYSSFAHRRPHGLDGHPEIPTTRLMYAHLLSNSGTLNAYENLAVTRGHIREADDPGYKGEAYLASGRGTATIVKWTMTSVTVRVATEGPDELVLNQNFDNGWRVRRHGASDQGEAVAAYRNADGLIAATVGPEDAEVELFYLPQAFVIGSWISGATFIIGSMAWWLVYQRAGRTSRKQRA